VTGEYIAIKNRLSVSLEEFAFFFEALHPRDHISLPATATMRSEGWSSGDERPTAGFSLFSTANWHQGYCGTTDFGGRCESDPNGAWRLSDASSANWSVAEDTCARLCQSCRRCMYISVSLEHHDCSWFADCDLHALESSVTGFRSRYQGASWKLPYSLAHGQCSAPKRVMRIAETSHCPSSMWLDRLTPLLAHPSQPFTFVNVGANKGFGIASIVGRFGNATFSPQDWYHSMPEYLY
jgi:hypothetical protein